MADSDGRAVDREGLRIVPEAAPAVAEEGELPGHRPGYSLVRPAIPGARVEPEASRRHGFGSRDRMSAEKGAN
jgi:hypothetical protein